MRGRKLPRPLDREFFRRDALEVAPDLLNKVLVANGCSGRIVEVEAYRSDEPASHTFRGRTARNAVMFGDAGHLYVYFSYGMHHCANVVTGRAGESQAVLLRGLVPLEGLDVIRFRRPASTPTARLTDGPGKLCQALGIDLNANGTDLCAPGQLWIGDDGVQPPTDPTVTARIGITKAVDLPWRFVAPGPIAPAGQRPRAASGRGGAPARTC